MAKAAAFVTSRCTGHSCWPSRPAVSGSPDVFYNGLPAHRQGDLWAVHCCGSCHPGILVRGSPVVFTNGRQQGRVGDPVNCGSYVLTGSPNVFVGEMGSSGMCCKTQTATSNQATPSVDPAIPTVGGIPLGKDGSHGGTVPYYGSPGGAGPAGGSKSSGGPYTANGTQHATGTNANIKAPNTNVAKGLGGLSAKYESNGDPGSIGHDSTGGYSYGEYQIATKTGTMNNFLTNLQTTDPAAAARLQAAGGVDGATSGSSDFQTAWKNEASTNPQFAQDQQSFIQSTHYDVAVANIQNQTGLDINSRSLAVQDAVWSTAVQNGPNSGVFTQAFAGQNVNQMSDADIINSIYNERGATNSDGSLKYFSSSSQNVQNSVSNRFTNERQTALGMLNSSPGS